MNYITFKMKLENTIKKFLGKGFSLEYSDEYTMMIKNDECPVMAEINSLSAYYAYEEVKNYAAVENEIKKIIDQYKEKIMLEGLCERAKDFNNIRSQIFRKIVNTSTNEEMLKDVPHYEFEDLSVTFYIKLMSSENRSATCMVTNELMKDWNIDIDTLLNEVIENEKMFEQYDFCLVKDKTKSMERRAPKQYELYTISNLKGINGATALLDTKVLSKLANYVDQNLYLIPSSVHEILAMPDTEIANEERLSAILDSMNSVIDEQTFLSDHLFYFDKDTKTVMSI